MDYIDILGICADISAAIDELKYLASTGELTEERKTAYEALIDSMEDFKTSFDFYR